jgi:hypothetical protein
MKQLNLDFTALVAEPIAAMVDSTSNIITATSMNFIDRKTIEVFSDGINSHSTCNKYVSDGSKFKKETDQLKA